MKKVILLDSYIISNQNSYSHNILNLIENKLTSRGHLVERYDLNKTHSKTVLSADNISTYYNDIESDKWIDLLKSSNVLVIGMPMVNFGPATVVKNFIDSIAIAEKTFSYKNSTNGMPVGYLDNLKVVIVGTQGSPEGATFGQSHVDWLKSALTFLGVKDFEVIKCFGTSLSPHSDLTMQESVKLFENQVDKIIQSI
ncbi:FMN-dependent NADH-azoreductase [Mycoplasma nasistruthionis]|uniref:FMN-dependent NADH-azoreductase n=1 Tax=Mycoplasma nasistruthionis TaxID=353852 RepID=A0A4Y6I6A2_9MOLU|nr:FMN-dependent NADH-azoreductase [Mycoplasma nasistruthionis]QCZ36536.1 FMN-dependent NADH-azoreductase [Mycoplasma nasistruthionis]QDF64830.1 FMN-dependent NADH-azoreductase [Mycoplasma nasistruthionis]